MARHSLKEQIISAGLAELHAHGYAACSVDSITKAAGVPKGSFYNHFASKEDFAVQVLRRYFENSGWPSSFEETSAIGRLRAGFEALRVAARERTYSRGCMWGNLASEVADHSTAIRAELAGGLDAWSAIVTDLVADAQRQGEIDPAADPSQLGRFIVSAWEGALTRSRVDRTSQALDDFFDLVFGILLGAGR